MTSGKLGSKKTLEKQLELTPEGFVVLYAVVGGVEPTQSFH
jgi:hypothetical protein